MELIFWSGWIAFAIKEVYNSYTQNKLLDRLMSRDFSNFKMASNIKRSSRNHIPKSKAMNDAEMADWEKKQDMQSEEVSKEIDERLAEAGLRP